MARNLTIERVEINPPTATDAAAAPPSANQAAPLPPHRRVRVTVKNPSRKDSVYAISAIRYYEYDAPTETLRLGLAERPPKPGDESVIVHRKRPHMMEIAPGASASLELPVPLRLHQILTDAGSKLGANIRTIDTTSAKHLEIKLACSTTPFYGKPAESTTEFRSRLASWGTIVEARVDAATGTRE
jgi:hypothetical protein